MNRIELLLVQAVLVFGATVPGLPVWAQGEEEESSELALLPLDVDIMRLSSASPSDQRSFVVTGETWVDVHVRASAGGLNVTVIAPGQETIDETTVGSFGGSYVELDGAETSASLFPGLVCDQPTYHYVVRVPLEPPLVAGAYEVQVVDPEAREEVAVVVSVSSDSLLTANLVATPRYVALGNDVVLAAAVFEGADAFSGASVDVTIQPPEGDPASVTLVDDGGTADLTAGDGLYSGLFVPTVVGGHTAVAEISGTDSQGHAFSRSAAAIFEAVNAQARLTGQLRDFAVDSEPQDGYVDLLAVEVEVEAFESGTYGVNVVMELPNGRTRLGQEQSNLDAGTHWVRTELPASWFIKDCLDGPYKVTFVELVAFTAEGAIPIDRLLAEFVLQSSVPCEEFQRPKMELTGANSIDATADSLTIDLGVRVTAPGTYHYAASLRACGRHVELISGDQALTADPGGEAITLVFDASRLGPLGVDGPYELRDLTLHGMGASLLRSRVLQTPAYDAATFMGYQPPSDCNHNGMPDLCDFPVARAEDCNRNGIADACELAAGRATDCYWNGTLDDCELAQCAEGNFRCQDCQPNGVPDPCDLRSGTSTDCNANRVPDECEPDCNDNGVADECDIDAGTALDLDLNGVPDECQGGCCLSNGTPGCNDPACADAVCQDHAYCCFTEWDGACADWAAINCTCLFYMRSCCIAHWGCGEGACANATCRETVCNLPDGDHCCTVRWDYECVELAIEHCQVGCCNQDSHCDDGLPCTDDYCHMDFGLCDARPRVCDDQNVCTSDSCDPETGCVHTPVPGGCDDGNPCTQNDQCDGEECAGTPVPDCAPCAIHADCDDLDTCTTDRCEDGVCSFASRPDGESCDDFDGCTVDESCQAGRCVGTVVPGCIDCQHDGDCDDWLSCTQDKCVGSACVHTVRTVAAPVLDGVYDLEGTPRDVAVGNLDNVNGLDVAVLEQASDVVSIFLEDGDGAFTLSASYAVDSWSFSLALGDLDGDGDVDLVATSASDSASVLLNDGTGVFTAGGTYAVGERPEAVAVGFLNDDEHLDIAVANLGSDDVSILQNDGGGSFLANTPIGLSGGPVDITIGDVDQKNGADIVVAMHAADSVAVLYNDGQGSFGSPQERSAEGAVAVVVGDLDGANELDIVIAKWGGADLTVQLGDGQGGWEAIDYDLGASPESVAMGDLDGDGDQDISAVFGLGKIVIGYNDGTGAFPAPWTEVEILGYPRGLASGDIDGNGAADLAVVSQNAQTLSLVRSTVPSHCLIEGLCIEAGSPKGDSPCEECNPLRCVSGWAPLPSGVYVADCADDAETNPTWYCTFDQCVNGACANTPWRYGDVNHDGVVSVFDILCQLAVVEGADPLPPGCDPLNADITGGGDTCGPNGFVSVFDIFAVLNVLETSVDPCCGQTMRDGGPMASPKALDRST